MSCVTFFATAHGRRLLNGHSGFSPPSYVARQRALTDPPVSPPPRVGRAVRRDAVIVHERAWADGTGSRARRLESAGAQVIASDEGAALVALNPVRRNAQRGHRAMTAMLSRISNVSIAWRAMGWYIVATIVMTWPVTPNLTRDIPGDLAIRCSSAGRSRAADHWSAPLSGDLSAVTRFGRPASSSEPLATASGPLRRARAPDPAGVGADPRHHPLLATCCSWRPTSWAGQACIRWHASSPAGTRRLRRRIVVHVRALSRRRHRAPPGARHSGCRSRWGWPSLRRYFASRRSPLLAGGAAGVILQSLSSGYYMIYFGPFVVSTRRRWGRADCWPRAARAGAIHRRRHRVGCDATVRMAASTLPQRRFRIAGPLAEIERYSGDLLTWMTASTDTNAWGWCAWPQDRAHCFRV